MAGRASTGVPIALPVVRILFDAEGAPAVTVDREPYAVPSEFRRDQVRGLIRELAGDLGPIRVEITESNGERYVDIQTPSDQGTAPPDPAPLQPAGPGVRGRLESGDDVLVAVVVARRTAQPDGTLALRLPPAFLQRYGNDVLVIGADHPGIRS